MKKYQSKQTSLGVKECCCINRPFRDSRTHHRLFINLCGQLSCSTLQTVIQWAIQNWTKKILLNITGDSVIDRVNLMTKHNPKVYVLYIL